MPFLMLLAIIKNWGFCLAHSERKKLSNGIYYVKIDSSFKDGYLHYGQIFIKGRLKKEIVFSTYICHPSMANNEISGIVVAIYLSNFIKKERKLVIELYLHQRP